MPTLTDAVLSALREAPCSLRALAREAGVSPTLLTLMTRGERAVTPAVAEKLAGAMDRWARSGDIGTCVCNSRIYFCDR